MMLTCFLILLISPSTIQAKETDIFVINDYGCLIAYHGYGKEVTIPDGVKTIRSYAFAHNNRIETVHIPDSVTTIENYAFGYCTNLKNIEMSKSITDISGNAFFNTKWDLNLTQEFVIFNHILYSVNSNKKTIRVPKTVTTINYNAFSNTQATTVILPSSVTTIHSGAFYLSKLTKLSYTKALTNISSSAFKECPFYTKQTKNGTPLIINGILVDGSKCKGNVSINKRVTKIADYAFGWGNAVFSDCYTLQTISLPSGSIELPDYTFYNCISLNKVTLPKTITKIGSRAFHHCYSLVSIDLSDEIEEIGHGAFDTCNSLTEIHIPTSLTSISNGCFSSCSNLIEIELPDSIESIGNGAFEDCSNLTEISFSETLDDFGYDCFYGTPWYNERKKEGELLIVNHVLIDGSDCVGEVVIPDSVTVIGHGAFQARFSTDSLNEESQITSVQIPDSVKKNQTYAFESCTKLRTLDLPDSIRYIGYRAFGFPDEMMLSYTLPENLEYYYPYIIYD